MKYSLLSLMIAEEVLRANVGPVGIILIALGILGVGIFFIATPAKQLIQFDRRSGYRLYEREMKASGDETRAIAAAAMFYKVLGGCIVVFGLAWLALGVSLFWAAPPT